MSTYLQVAEQLYGGLDKVREAAVQLRTAGEHAGDAADVLVSACAGSGADDVEQACGLWHEVRVGAGDLIGRCLGVVALFERYLSDVLGVSPDRMAIAADVALAGSVPSKPVNPEQHEHI